MLALGSVLEFGAHLFVLEDVLLHDRDGPEDRRMLQPFTFELFLAEVIPFLDEADYPNTVLVDRHNTFVQVMCQAV